jgi:uncharacterized protein YbjT (DUF2867 family)
MAAMKIAVAGATGRLGPHIVDVLEERGHEVVPMSRATGVDVITGEGLDEALRGVDVVIDAATQATPDEQTATDFFTASTANLQAASRRAGVRRIVVVSIIGIERAGGGFLAAKLAHERAMLAGPVPVAILRAAQFHEFVGQMLDWTRAGDVAYVPRMRTQLVACRTVAEALADLATDPSAPVSDGPPYPEIAGPREDNLVDAATLLAQRRGEPARIEPVSSEHEWERELNESGALLPSPHATLAGPTYAEWLDAAQRVDAAA